MRASRAQAIPMSHLTALQEVEGGSVLSLGVGSKAQLSTMPSITDLVSGRVRTVPVLRG